MSDYRHNRVPGRTYYFTVRLADHRSTLLTDHIAAFGEAIRQVRTKRPFHVDAWVALPAHAHAIWTLPPGDTDCASRWRAVKIAFSKSVRKSRKLADGNLWARQYRQYEVEGEGEYEQLVDYLHGNPVRHGYCQQAQDWPWSSVHRFITEGLSGQAEPEHAMTRVPPAEHQAAQTPHAE